MAELQTDINVKIKLGDEKTSSGESNLPAIDKGSIVITKDTNRIYIDTTDDVPERIEIGENKQDKFVDISYEDNIDTNDKLVLTPNVDNSITEVYFNISGSPSWQAGSKALSAPFIKTKNGYIIGSSNSMPSVLMSNATTQATTPIISFASANNKDLVLRGIANGSNDSDAVNVKQLAGKQDKITETTTLGIAGLRVTATSTLYSQVSSSYINFFNGDSAPLLYLSPQKYTSSTPTQLNIYSYSQASTIGHTNVIISGVDTPTMDNEATNKKYVDDIKTELLNAITHPYTYDETTKELTLIL